MGLLQLINSLTKLINSLANMLLKHLLKSSLIYPLPSNLSYNGFSTFKTKFEKLQATNYTKVNIFYEQLTKFENTLQHLQKIKYKKAVEDLQKKVRKIQKKQLQSNSIIQDTRQFSTNITYELLYRLQNNRYKPIGQQMIVNKIQLSQLYKKSCGSNSRFQNDFNPAYQTILSNPSINNTLYSKIQQRCQYIDQQLSMNIYQGYIDFVKKKQQSINSKENLALKNLKGVSKDNFSKDLNYTFINTMDQNANYYASEIAKIICKFGFASEKMLMVSLKSLSNERYKTVSPPSLANHLFILGYHKVQIPQINSKLFELFQLVLQQTSQKLQFFGQIGPINSFLFYLLSNKIDMHQLFKLALIKLQQNYRKYMSKKQNKDLSAQKNKINICQFDKQIFWIMLNILKAKQGLILSYIDQQQNPQSQKITLQDISKTLAPVSSNSHQDFERYLIKKKYIYKKSVFQPTKASPSPNSSTTQDIIFTIQQKNFLCLNLTRFHKISKKLNGVGQIILSLYHFVGKPLKIINPIVLHDCQKWGQKQEYFKTKLKGITQPIPIRKKIFDI